MEHGWRRRSEGDNVKMDIEAFKLGAHTVEREGHLEWNRRGKEHRNIGRCREYYVG